MDGDLSIRRGASISLDPTTAAQELYETLYDPAAKLVVFYCSPDHDLEALAVALRQRFGSVPLVGCTTAGEITPVGYLDGALTGVGIAGDGFDARVTRIDGLRDLEVTRADAAARDLVRGLAGDGETPTGREAFAFLLADGLCMQEEGLVAAIHRNLGDIQLVGGSAGDGTRFAQTFIYHDGEFRTDCAVLVLARCASPFEVFKTEHFVASSDKMVVTAADPAQRIVTEINGAPAGREYARLVGLDLAELTPLVFAAHPVIVRVGGEIFVRSIQKVNDDESLSFFCAIDEGIVLTVARGHDMVANLEDTFEGIRAKLGPPALVLGCDCILRRVEAEQRGVKDKIGSIMAANNVIGFATYGEQFNGMHVNQTFAGVAIGRKQAA